jgi:AcrR family transcriptional regulator
MYRRDVAETPEPRRQRRLPRAETRRRVLDAAARVFAQRGYDAATLDDVAAAAGFSKGAVYSNFADKREVFLSLMQERIAERVDRVRGVTERSEGAAEQIEGAAGELEGLLDTEADWHLLFIEFWTRAVRDPELRARLAEQRRPMRDLIAGFLEGRSRALDRPLPAPADDLAVIVLALSNGLAVERLADPAAVGPELYATALRLLFAPEG